MARLDWMTFLATHPTAHLLAGQVPDATPAVLKRLRRLMQALIDAEEPVADYATAIVRHRDVTEIQCGFANCTDADRVAEHLGATSLPANGDWLSERSLTLDQRAERALEAKAAPRKAMRPAGSETPARSRI